MKIATLILALSAGAAMAQTYVDPHLRKDGTYVPGHYRTAPNSTLTDNYSTKGNVNPYTGQAGTVDPYKVQTPKAPSYGTNCGYTSKGNYVCR